MNSELIIGIIMVVFGAIVLWKREAIVVAQKKQSINKDVAPERIRFSAIVGGWFLVTFGIIVILRFWFL